MHKAVYISLGSNEGNSVSILERACAGIADKLGEIVAKSSYYETDSWGFETDNKFVNSVICVHTKCGAEETLKILIAIEEKLGRVRSNVPGYQSRPIDLDIIDYAGETIETNNLISPHPRMHLRAFVLVPLQEIAARWLHPLTGQGLTELINSVEGDLQVDRILP